MDQIYPDQGLVKMLRLVAGSAGNGNYWKAFTSNTTPSLASVVADFTFASATYFETQLDETAFTLEQVSAHIGSIQAPNIVWTNGSGGSVTLYGYCILDPSKTKLIAAARFDAAPVVVPNGGNVVVIPIYGDYSALTS